MAAQAGYNERILNHDRVSLFCGMPVEKIQIEHEFFGLSQERMARRRVIDLAALIWVQYAECTLEAAPAHIHII